jgi:hypothetical protein
MPSSLFYPIEGISKGLKTIDPVHAVIHDGQHYIAEHYVSVGTGTAASVLIVPPVGATRYIHFNAYLGTNLAGVLQFSEDPNASGGTSIVPFNSNRPQSINYPNPVVITHTPTYVSSGTVMETLIATSTGAPYISLGTGNNNPSREYILESGKTYLLRFVSDVAANRVLIKMAYYYKDI